MATTFHASERAIQALERAPNLPGLLRATCRELTGLLDADGCVLSRVIGELLIEVAEHSSSGRMLQLGHGYLIPDYPLTEQVVEGRRARAVALADPDADPAEAKLLEELGFECVLMLPLCSGGECWGLIEVYGGSHARLDLESASIAEPVVRRAGELLERLRFG